MFGRDGNGEYVGSLDEVAVYDAKLTHAQVQHLYAGGDPTNLPTLPQPVSTVGTFTGGDVGEGLDLEGNFLYAINVGTAGLPNKNGGTLSVGDVIFAHEAAVSGMSNTQGSVINNWATPILGASADDDNLEFAMQSIRHGGAQPARIDLSGLTPGREYKMQMMFTESCCNRGFDVYLEDMKIADDFSPRVTQGGSTNTPVNGAVVTATFTAGDTVANVVFNAYGTTFSDKNPILSALTLEDISSVAGVPVNVALGKPIVDGSSAYNNRAFDDNTQGFSAMHVTDGSDIDVFGQSYWLATDGQANQYFVLDLEESYAIDRIDLFNTHNTGSNDRGTANFQIRASNDLATIIGGSPSASIILTGMLPDVSNTLVIPAESFTEIEGLLTGEYRYLRFETLSAIHANNNVGLNEIAVYSTMALEVSQVPEPSSLVLAMLGLFGLAMIARRRRLRG